MLVVKKLYGWSYEQTERFVSDSIVLRQFCRIYLEPAPDDTTLIRWANQIGSETVASLNQHAVELAKSLKVTRGRKLRVWTPPWSKLTSTLLPTAGCRVMASGS